MKIAPLADVKARLSAYLEQCEMEGPIVITRNGKAVAVLLAPADDDDLQSLLFARSPRFQALLDKSRGSIRAGKGLGVSDFWKGVGHRHRKQGAGRRASKAPLSGRPNPSSRQSRSPLRSWHWLVSCSPGHRQV
jgi:prevent-host-death family protein